MIFVIEFNWKLIWIMLKRLLNNFIYVKYQYFIDFCGNSYRINVLCPHLLVEFCGRISMLCNNFITSFTYPISRLCILICSIWYTRLVEQRIKYVFFMFCILLCMYIQGFCITTKISRVMSRYWNLESNMYVVVQRILHFLININKFVY
jgi:hypothetical protein